LIVNFGDISGNAFDMVKGLHDWDLGPSEGTYFKYEKNMLPIMYVYVDF